MTYLTPEEEFRITGKLSGDNAANALDALGGAAEAPDIEDAVIEAKAQFPDEDFLENVLDDVHDVLKNVRGANKERMLGILEAITDVQQMQVGATAYAFEKLNKLIEE